MIKKAFEPIFGAIGTVGFEVSKAAHHSFEKFQNIDWKDLIILSLSYIIIGALGALGGWLFQLTRKNIAKILKND